MPSERRTGLVRYLAAAVVVLLMLAGCQASTQIEETLTADAEEQGSTEDTERVATGAALEGVLSSADVYESIQDSVVYVEAPDEVSSGSGIVIDGGWILTNAHVVERFGEMRIGRSDGTDLGLHEVHAVDWVFDLALVGPVDDPSLVPMKRGDSSELRLGSRVLLAGFPDEDSSDPTPTLTEGIVSRRRSVALGDHPFLQVDATIAPGQSGGALIDARGGLVGISGLEFGAGEFGLVFESDAMWPRVDTLLASPRISLPTGEGVFELSEEVGPRRNFSFTVEVDESGALDMIASSPADIFVEVQTLGGFRVSQFEEVPDPFAANPTETQLFFDDLVAGGEDAVATVDPGTYQVVVGSFDEQPAEVIITSSNVLRRFVDSEEGASLPTNEIVEGAFDWTQDSDRWELSLAQGQQVEIIADGIADTVLAVRFDGEVVTSGDDEGLGLFGEAARVEFVAEQTGIYTVEIGTYDLTRWGYLIEASVS